MSLWLHAFNHGHFTVPPFYSFIVNPWRHVTKRPCHWATIIPCHLPHRLTMPHATLSDCGTCHIVSPCHLSHRFTVPLVTPSHRGNCYTLFHRATFHTDSLSHMPKFPTVPFAITMPLLCHHDIWCATVAACRRRPTRHLWHIGITPYTHAPGILHYAPDICTEYLRTLLHCLIRFHNMLCC